ncbi:MAG TPA: hypothetical protein VFW65_20960 [Pseudonocardiaceae bacterium]|nr:hypothetical protein [Pseudonocardiaceae bacterium]
MTWHCLLIETDRDGLVLVDTGLGVADVDSPRQRLGADWGWLSPIRCSTRTRPRWAAVRQPDGWLLHAGDAYFYHGELDADPPQPHPELQHIQDGAQVDPR